MFPSAKSLGRILILFGLLVYCGALKAQPAADTSTPRKNLVPDVFAYIEDFEVRYEILIPFDLMESCLQIPRADPDFIEVEEQMEAREVIASYFLFSDPIEIDGIPVYPEDSRVEFLRQDIQSITGALPLVRLRTDNAYVGIIYTYSTKGPPSSVGVGWFDFNAVITSVRCTLYPHGKTSKQTLTEGEPQFLWENEGRTMPPPVSEVLTDGESQTTMSPDQARTLFSSLLKNVYRSFDYRDEERIYDSLAKSADGELLPQIYLQMREGLAVESGAKARVEEVSLRTGEISERIPQGFAYDAEWTVRGRVEHWGHIHERTNLYGASFQILAVEGSWKLTQMRVRKLERLETKTGPRALIEKGN